MDDLLKKALRRLDDVSEELRKSEHLYLELEANRKPMLAKLTVESPGKSHAERETLAYQKKEWTDFAKGLALAESDFNYAKRKYSILENAFFAELAGFKREIGIIKKHGIHT